MAKREETGECEDTKIQTQFCVNVCNLAENEGVGVYNRINNVVLQSNICQNRCRIMLTSM